MIQKLVGWTLLHNSDNKGNLTLIWFTNAGAPFPFNFQEVVKTIFKRLFRVYAHIYHSHFQKIINLKEEPHLNTCFKHFVLFTWVSFITYLCCLFFFFYLYVEESKDNFVILNNLQFSVFFSLLLSFQEFRLINKGELAPLYELIESILQF